ncbi:hypothetical protein [Cupriavidus oxalaticus]|uniref:Uncharacterized protein n=1 Tax=Cupriavidus oxalaticus TaxID=96344 RepID=A0A4P7LS02_9BURK|nr:hypothetical protein [Cupriavidus oxalaticus]QBY56453.1 hypothetical protein E0W60_36325 [Cupriavidus oxalaticus]
MATESPKKTSLGTISLLSCRDVGARAWELQARAQRVPRGKGNKDTGGTPGVHAIRTTWLRVVDRTMQTSTGASLRYVDPVLEEIFVSATGTAGQVSLLIAGTWQSVQLSGEQRVEASGVGPHPFGGAGGIDVPPYVLHEGSLELAAGALSDVFVAKNVDIVGPVLLERECVVFTAHVPRLDKPADRIQTCVRLSMSDGNHFIELLPARQSSHAAFQWRAVWSALRTVLATSQQTAWLRADFFVGEDLPSLTWPVTVSNGRLQVDWSKPSLPQDITRIWLADQPMESQLLPPERVLELAPRKTELSIGSNFIRLSRAVSGATSANISYVWRTGTEHMDLGGKVPLVHAARKVLQQLRGAYGEVAETRDKPEIGFVAESRGWVALPFAPESDAFKLPKRVAPADSKEASGGLCLGLRRHDLRQPGVPASEVPWSVQLDAPEDFSFALQFDLTDPAKPELSEANVTLAGCALRIVGALWLAARKPDGDDALPRVDADADAFVPVELANCYDTGRAPFVLEGCSVLAPSRASGVDWDAAALRWKRSPSLGAGAALRIRPKMLDPGASPLRGWFRHPKLPTIQAMPLTRYNLTSVVPHASRALEPYTSAETEFVLTGLQTLSPRIGDKQRATFEPLPNVDMPAAALTMPGVATRAQNAATYYFEGSYSLVVCTEPQARTGVPVDEEQNPTPREPVITARDPAQLVQLAQERARMGKLAEAQDARMFPATPAGSVVAVVPDGLAPPLTWSATAQVSDAVDFANWTLGSVTFKEVNAWTWRASGDMLLIGPNGKADLSRPGSVSLGGNGQVAVVGWSLADRDGAATVRDGRGMSSEKALRSDTFVRRSVSLGNRTGELRSSLQVLPMAGPGIANWCLAFTDLYVEEGAADWKPPAGTGAASALDVCWTWSLFVDDGGVPFGMKKSITSLSLGGVFRFAPAALVQVSFDAQGKEVTGCVIDGALGLGAASRPRPNDPRCRVRLTFVASAHSGLNLSGISTPWPGNTVEWELDDALEIFGTDSARLSGVPQIGLNGLKLVSPSMTMQVLGSLVTVKLVYVPGSDRQLKLATGRPGHTPLAGALSIADVRVDLATATLSRLEVDAQLRTGVTVCLVEAPGMTPANVLSVQWFGNVVSFKEVHVDPISRSFTLGSLDPQKVRVIPGCPLADLVTASLAFTTAEEQGGSFKLRSVFFEIVAKSIDGTLTISHLMHQSGDGAPRDAFRFDGGLNRESAIGWPELEPPALGTADSVEMAFAGRPPVGHLVAIRLADHRIDGSQIEPRKAAGVAGIRLRGSQRRQPAATWLVEAHQEFRWTGYPATRFEAAVAMQLWSATELAEAIKDLGDNFAFTPSYRGDGVSVPDFPDPGVRRVRIGMAGLFGPAVVKALKNLEDTWIVVGSGSFLVPANTTPTAHLHLHLPMVAILDAPGDDEEYLPREPLRQALRDALSVDARVKPLRMSRHDLLNLPVVLPPDTAEGLGKLSRPAEEPVPFAMAFIGAQGTSGAQLGRGFLHEGNEFMEVCWHVEQFQRAGKSNASLGLPFVFPRAAVMLCALRDWPMIVPSRVLSILVAFDDSSGDRHSHVRTVSVEPIAPESTLRDRHLQADLVVGTTNGIKLIPVKSGKALAEEGPSQLLQAVLGTVSAPAFVVLRTVDQGPLHVALRLPLAKGAALASVRFPLRLRSTFLHTDNRRTWPERTGNPLKSQMDVVLDARSHRRSAGMVSTSLHGMVAPARLAGDAFSAVATPKAATVWLQRNEDLALASLDLDVQDAAPVATAGTRMVRAVVPSTRSLAEALVRADSTLADAAVSLQTYLPPVLYDFDQSDRAGAFSLSRARVLWAPAGANLGSSARAFAGPTAARWARLPRPQALPVNDGLSGTWRRPVGWYGQPEASCLVLRGRWNAFFGVPDKKSGVPAWGLLIGQPEPQTAASSGQDLLWRGTVRIRCLALGSTTSNAAARLMALLDAQKESVRAGLRHESGWAPFERVTLERTDAGDKYLVFHPAEDSPLIRGEGDCVFELALDVAHNFPEAVNPEVERLEFTAKEPLGANGQLAPVSFHSIGIKVFVPRAGTFALPLTGRTVFFDDPEYDLALSKVEPASANGLTGPVSAQKRYQIWVDRGFVTPGETMALRAGGLPVSLTAAVKRRDSANFEVLQFKLTEMIASEAVSLEPGRLVSLPLSMLANGAGALCPGDLLMLRAKASPDDSEPANLFIGVKSRSALPAPEAMYSLLAFEKNRDPKEQYAWCALHSPNPAADTLSSYQRDDEGEAKLVRRAHFRWESTESSLSTLEFGIMKTHLPSESTHIPESAEKEVS